MNTATITFEPIPELDGAPGALILSANSLPPYRERATITAVAKMQVYVLPTGGYSLILEFQYAHHKNENRRYDYAIASAKELIESIFNAKDLSARIGLQLVNFEGLNYVSADAPAPVAASDDGALTEE